MSINQIASEYGVFTPQELNLMQSVHDEIRRSRKLVEVLAEQRPGPSNPVCLQERRC